MYRACAKQASAQFEFILLLFGWDKLKLESNVDRSVFYLYVFSYIVSSIIHLSNCYFLLVEYKILMVLLSKGGGKSRMVK